MDTTTASQLRMWAAGGYAVEAATELLIRAFNGRFAQHGNPWIKHEDGYSWIDFAAINDSTTGVLSSGERRVLELVAALGSDRPVAINLGSNLAGLDPDRAGLVLAAMAHATGSHEQCSVVHNSTTGDVQHTTNSSHYSWSTKPADEDVPRSL